MLVVFTNVYIVLLRSLRLTQIRSHLHAIATNWGSTYALQENYCLLEVLLGFENFVNTVPKAVRPELETQEPLLSTNLESDMPMLDIGYPLEGTTFDAFTNSPT
jgi:hypothetical protein